MSSSSDPAVTIRFSGEGEGAIKSANAVAAALDNLSIKSKLAQTGLASVSRVMDDVSSKSARVSAIGAAYQSASVGIANTLTATRASASAFGTMAASADAAAKKVEALNNAVRSGSKVKAPEAVPSSSTPGSPGGSNRQGRSANPAASVSGLLAMGAATVGISVGLATIGDQVRELIAANADLDKAMSSVAAVGNLDKLSTQYKELTELVVDLGGKTQYSAAEAATGLKELVAGGYAASDAASMLKDTLALAATENMALGRASEIVVAGLQSFRLEVDQTARLTDVLARGANASTASIDGLGEAFKYLAPVASALNISLEDSAAVVSILANNGVQAGLAGRGMGAILSRMIAPTKDAQAVLKQFNVSLAEINPSISGLGGAMNALTKIDTAGLVTLFGSENLDVSNILKANAGGFDEMVAKMKDVEITAEGMANKKNDNGAGDFKKMLSAIQEVRVELGKDLYASIRESVQSFTSYLRENKEEIVSGVKYVGNLVVALTPLLGIYAAVKTTALAAHLAKQAIAWTAESLQISRNTTLLTANASARARMNAMGIRGISGSSAGIKGSLAEIFVGGVEGAGPKLGKAVTSLGAIAVAAIAGWETGAAVEKWLGLGEKLEGVLFGSSDAASSMANDLVSGSAEMLQNAKSAKDLEEAKAKISRDLETARRALSNEKGGTDEFNTMLATVNVLRHRLETSDKIYARNQQIAETEKKSAEALALHSERAGAYAAALQLAEVHAANLLASSKELSADLPDFGKKILDSLPDSEALDIFKGQESKAVSVVSDLRSRIEQELEKSGANMTLIDTSRSIKDVDDILAYARTVIGLAQKNDKAGNLLGMPEMASLKKAAEDAMEARSSSRSRQSSVDSKLENEKRVKQEISGIEAEIAINRAKAAGDTKLANSLQREKDIMEEKLKLQTLLGKGTKEGSPEQSIAFKKADDLAARKVDSEISAKKPEGGEVRAMSLGAQGINTFFGRGANDGAYEEAKKHTSLLTQVVKLLTPRNNAAPAPVEFVPVFR